MVTGYEVEAYRNLGKLADAAHQIATEMTKIRKLLETEVPASEPSES
jgi:hypothetical protein